MKSVRLLLISDPRWSEERIAAVVEQAARAVPGFAVQLRDRSDRSDDELLPFARRLREITSRHGATLIVNRRFELGRRVGADGVHAPVLEAEAETERTWRSAPAHSDEDVRRARDAGVDAVLVSPIFEVPGKGLARGLGAIRTACALAPELQVLALGGVNMGNAAQCVEAGASGVAVIRALLDAADPAGAARTLAARGVD
ncbi:MAG TPA: thiamine phosphate synthase [Polyangiaceae bacterium]|nr:thiamine phosphate synthase [Polyangiaceae bacterium]